VTPVQREAFAASIKQFGPPTLPKPHIKAGIWTPWACIGKTMGGHPICGVGNTPKAAYAHMIKKWLTWPR
jgi:hypothetical protein